MESRRRDAVIPVFRALAAPRLLFAISATALTATLLSAAGIVVRLWLYLLAAVCLWVASMAVSAWNHPRYRLIVFAPLYRDRLRLGPGTERSCRSVWTADPHASLLAIAAGAADDPFYEAGLTCLLSDSERPLIVFACNPRDVSMPQELVFPMVRALNPTDPVIVDPRKFGLPARRLRFRREFPEGGLDDDFTLAVRDLAYVGQLIEAFRGNAPAMDDALPLLWPEHCVDPQLLAGNNVIVIGGPDTNFWHAAMFEAVTESFERPPSTVPLAFSLRDALEGGVPTYSSRHLHVRLAGPIPDLPEPSRHGGAGLPWIELDERTYPTYGFVLVSHNPYSGDGKRWCAFIAGTRSLGTSGAVFALARVIENMRASPGANFASLVPTPEAHVYARVSAMLCRTTRVHVAPLLGADGKISERTVRSLPVDARDKSYSDTYLPAEVQVLDYSSGSPLWRDVS